MRPRQGYGLLLALVVIVVMMTALGLLAASMRTGMQEVRTELRTVSLIALTDAAMAETLARLTDDEGFGGVAEYAFGDGLISSEVRSIGVRRVEILARASYGGRSRTMRAAVRLTAGGPVVLGLR